MATVTKQQYKEYVKEVQRYLRAIAYYDERVPLVAIDGKYDAKTQAAVGAFQTIAGLPVTGEVDKATFERLYFDYNQLVKNQSPAKTIQGFPKNDRVLQEGDSGNEVYFLQVMLRALSERFDNIFSVDVTGNYDSGTKEAVDTVKRAAGIYTPGVDKKSWDAVTQLYNHTI